MTTSETLLLVMSVVVLLMGIVVAVMLWQSLLTIFAAVVLTSATTQGAWAQGQFGDLPKTVSASDVEVTEVNYLLFMNHDSLVVTAVKLNNRTLYKDGKWNTLCLPFDVTIADSPLAGDGVAVMELNGTTSGLDSEARAMTRAIVNFGDDETTGIRDNNRETITNKRDDQWYTLSGQRIDKPSAKGVYIHYGKKVIIM